MSLQSLIGDLTSNVGNTIQSGLDQLRSFVGGIGESIGTFTANIYSGGFAGLSDFNDLYSALKTYSDGVQAAVAEYNPDADLDVAFRGDVQAAVQQFVKATKDLLDGYAKYIEEQWTTELKDVYTRYTEQGQVNVANKVSADAEQVQQAAQNISLG